MDNNEFVNIIGLRRKHQNAQRQAPKDLKERDQSLKKRFRDDIKAQDKQYKV